MQWQRCTGGGGSEAIEAVGGVVGACIGDGVGGGD